MALICAFLLSSQEEDSEITRQKASPAGQFLYRIFRLLHHFDHIRIFRRNHIGLCFLVEVSVIQKFRSRNAFLYCLCSQFRIVTGKGRHLIRIGIQNVKNSQSKCSEYFPPKERKLKHKTLPLMSFHHLSGQCDSLPRRHVRILSHNIRYKEIRVMLDHYTHERQTPQ